MNDLLSDRIENSGYSYKKLGHDAYLVYNFLKPHELEQFVDLAENALPPEWCFMYLRELEESGLRHYGRKDVASLIIEGKLMLIPRNLDQVLSTLPLSDLVSEITDRVNQLLPPDYQSDSYGVIKRQYEGVALEDHRDTDCNPNLRYATVIYLNDHFDGGELYFKDEDLTMEIKPPPASIIIFNAGRLHGVNPVRGDRTRYVLTSFVSKVGDDARFDRVANPVNPTEPDRADGALKHFLETGYQK